MKRARCVYTETFDANSTSSVQNWLCVASKPWQSTTKICISHSSLKEKAIHSSYIHNSPKSFLQLNAKTKIATPLRRKKKKRKRLENWETTCLCQPSGKWKHTHWQNNHWRSNYFVAFYVFHVFYSMLNIPILHRVACVKSRTPKQQSTPEAEQFLSMKSSAHPL